MEESEARGYVQLGPARGPGRSSHPPIDRCNCIYFSLLFAGVGFLLPYNSFIIAVDYYQERFPGTTIVFDMSLVYILTAFVAVLGNNVLVEALSLGTRISFGYVVSLLTLLFVLTCEVWWEAFPANVAYSATLCAVAVVALGCTVQQSSFYGYTSMLPPRYTQAVMAGESAAGFLVSVNRIATKWLLHSQRLNTGIFFALSIVMVAVCCALHRAVQRTDFVQFYLAQCADARRITLEPSEDAGLMEPGEPAQYGVLKLHASPPPNTPPGGEATPFSFANPAYEPAGAAPTFKVEDVVTPSVRAQTTPSSWAGLGRGLAARREVAAIVWRDMLAIGLAYCVTLSLYPGIESEVVSCRLGTWMPVALMAVFNGADLLGKVLASTAHAWSRTQLLWLACARALLVPLTLMCAAPRGNPWLPGEGWPLLLALLLGLSNGLVGSLPMIQAAGRVAGHRRELAGNIMTLSYNVGLTCGSVLAYLLDAIVGPALPGNGCIVPVPVTTVMTTAATTTTLMPNTTTSVTLLTTLITMVSWSTDTPSTIPSLLSNGTTILP